MEETGLGATEVGILGTMLIGAIVVGLVIYLFIGFCYGKIFERAGKPMWAGFVPIYNLVILTQIIGRPAWWVAVMLLGGFIPFVGTFIVIAVNIILSIDLAKSFGKDTTFGVLLGLLGFIFVPVLAFSDAQYIGPSAAGKTGVEI